MSRIKVGKVWNHVWVHLLVWLLVLLAASTVGQMMARVARRAEPPR